ncbi:H-NS histone family protein [Sphaerotilus montanus]|jgi:DNA-binding protein H-NS|uniref:DNA-binding protein H-NS n=1 Tax=Sphaerotilus montanus TaxID=522889 RepID=A0A7Y9QWQ4_9BURK|nr:H-NS histone family protein [Sphaerotilus montanus]NYG31163.1 DNA-binding protein H-NS [Sphaerotilus montanus]NZD55149.1 H-NS histone family protein [Sphaerotilus montanus]
MKNTERQIVDSENDAERIAAIRKIRKLMDFWRITPAELRGRPIAITRTQSPAEIRYRHPLTQEVWDGQGTQPQWLRDALIKEGYTVEELRRTVQQQTPAAEADTTSAAT